MGLFTQDPTAIKKAVFEAINEAKRLEPDTSYILAVRRGSVSRQVLALMQAEFDRRGVRTSIIQVSGDPHQDLAIYKLVPPENPL